MCIPAWRRGFCLWLSFYLSNRVSLCSRYGFFCYTFTYFVPFWVIQNKVIKINYKSFNGNCDYIPVLLVDQFYFYMDHPIKAWLFEKTIFELDYDWASLSFFAFSYSFKITYILLKQVITLKKMVVLSAKLTILITLFSICVPLIFLSALMKLASILASIWYNSMESRHPWRTYIRVKGSDRRSFILILDSTLVYATLIMWMKFVSISELMQGCTDLIYSACHNIIWT